MSWGSDGSVRIACLQTTGLGDGVLIKIERTISLGEGP